MEAKLPKNPYVNTRIEDESRIVAYEDACKDMLQFFVDFLDEHIELDKQNNFDSTSFEILKANFINRFMSEKK